MSSERLKQLSSDRRIEDQPADIYVGFLGHLFSQDESSEHDAYIFNETRPFDGLRASCLFAQPWPNEMSADGLFWVDSQPDLCFRLSVNEGVASYRTYGRWLASRIALERFCAEDCQAFSGRPWHSVYGDRFQKIRFQGVEPCKAWLKESLAQCLIMPGATRPN